MNKDYYAILMYKINVDVEVVLYKAQTIIEGTLDEDDIFVSDNYDAYLDITNPSVIEESLDNAVGYVISEDDLLNKYPNFDIYKAKEMYMEDVRKYAHFGFYDYQSEAIKIVDVSLKDVLNKGVSNISNYIKECSDFYNNDKIDNYTKKIEQSFNEITNSDDAEEVYNQLENIMNIFTLLLCNLDKIDGKKIDKNKISNYLYEINDVMDAAKNMQIEEVKKSILSIEDKVINNVRKIENIERSFISNIEELEDEKISNQLKEPLNVIEAKNFMDERIIGLEEAKKVLISTFAFNRISDNSRNHCLIIGPSGREKHFWLELCKNI